MRITKLFIFLLTSGLLVLICQTIPSYFSNEVFIEFYETLDIDMDEEKVNEVVKLQSKVSDEAFFVKRIVNYFDRYRLNIISVTPPSVDLPPESIMS